MTDTLYQEERTVSPIKGENREPQLSHPPKKNGVNLPKTWKAGRAGGQALLNTNKSPNREETEFPRPQKTTAEEVYCQTLGEKQSREIKGKSLGQKRPDEIPS